MIAPLIQTFLLTEKTIGAHATMNNGFYLQLSSTGRLLHSRECRSLPTSSVFCPRARMLMAAFTSLSGSAPQSQLCHRSDNSFLRTVPHVEQICDVNLGETLRSVLPASSALLEHKPTNMPQLASRIDVFNPPFAAAPLGM